MLHNLLVLKCIWLVCDDIVCVNVNLCIYLHMCVFVCICVSRCDNVGFDLYNLLIYLMSLSNLVIVVSLYLYNVHMQLLYGCVVIVLCEVH